MIWSQLFGTPKRSLLKLEMQDGLGTVYNIRWLKDLQLDYEKDKEEEKEEKEKFADIVKTKKKDKEE